MGYLDSSKLATNLCMVVGTDDISIFGILTSRLHMAWVRTVGGKLETRYRYSAQLCYNTFPFPKLSAEKKQALSEAAEEVLLTRADIPRRHWQSSTTPRRCLKTCAMPTMCSTIWWRAAIPAIPLPMTRLDWNVSSNSMKR